VVEDAIRKYILQETSYREIAKGISASDVGELFPPCHIQVFNWVKHLAKQSAKLDYKLQKEMGLLGLFKEIESEMQLAAACPNAYKAHTRLKANRLNRSVGVLERLRRLSCNSAAVLEGIQAYFFNKVEHCEAILSGRPLLLAAPQSNEHVKRSSRIDCPAVPKQGREVREGERSPEMGAVSFRSNSTTDSSKPGESATPFSDERDFGSASFNTG
jgi:hypothetical protein